VGVRQELSMDPARMCGRAYRLCMVREFGGLAAE